MNLRLYDLAAAEPDRRFSPYCWRTRMALAHKGLPVETIPWRFTEKSALELSGQGSVPVLVDGDEWIADSWAIACHLEDRYPDRPSLFGEGDGRALCRFHSAIADGLVNAIASFIIVDVLDRLDHRDVAYFRQSREARFGKPLEQVVADREERLPAFRESLSALRATLKTQPYFGGSEPLHADYALFGPFQWARCISPFALLEQGDPVLNWRDRLLDRFGGLARAVPAYGP
jgi:glutathione S-transferase